MYTATNVMNSSSRIQNPYASSVAVSSISKSFSDSIAEAVYAPLAGSQSESQNSVTPDNFYDVLADLTVLPREENKFVDMYVRSSANLCRLSDSDRALLRSDPEKFRMDVSYRHSLKKSQAEQKRDCICVPIGAGEFPQFMKEIRQNLANGLSLTDALKNRADAYHENYHTEGISNAIKSMCFTLIPRMGTL